MRKRKKVVLAVVVVLGVLASAGIASADRLRPVASTPEELSVEEITERKAMEHVDVEAAPTEQELIEIRKAAAEERRLVEKGTPAALHARARDGGPPVAPPGLSIALDRVPIQAISGLENYVLVHSEADQSGSAFENTILSDGVGQIHVTKQIWPAGVDPQMFVSDDAVVERVGDLDVVVVDNAMMRRKIVRVFDGNILLSVLAFDTESVSIDDLKTAALNMHGEISE